MKKKSLLIIALTTMLGLTACGGADTVVDQELPRDDPSSEVSFEFWHCLGHEKTKNLTKVAEAFNTKYAGKYKVILKHPAGDYGALHSTLKTKMASGEVPAISMGYPDSFSEYISKRMGDSFLLRLTNYINDPDFGYTAEELADFVPGYYNEGTNYQFEGVWSMPMYKSTEVMYYNASYFAGDNAPNAKKFEGNNNYFNLVNALDGANATDEDLAALKTWVDANGGYSYDVPETWDQAIALSRKMLADRKAEKVTDVFYPFGYDSDANLLITQMEQRGIPYTSNDEASKNDYREHFKFNNPEAKALVNEIIGYLNEKTLVTKNSSSDYTNVLFTELKCAFTVGSTGGSSYNVSSNFKVKLAPVPYKNQRKYIQQGPSFCFFDCGDAYKQKGAWLFYKEFADASNNAKVALENSYDPVRISSYATDEYAAWIAQEGNGLQYDIPAMTATLKNYYMTSPVFIGSSTARDEIGNIISYIYSSNNSVDEAFDTAISHCYTAAK
ncbi:MAG: extracellular solute-binding protein [Bacilli bacterium]|nr:extracellular solute-binding protein [Bacilli bacterium]